MLIWAASQVQSAVIRPHPLAPTTACVSTSGEAILVRVKMDSSRRGREEGVWIPATPAPVIMGVSAPPREGDRDVNARKATPARHVSNWRAPLVPEVATDRLTVGHATVTWAESLRTCVMPAEDACAM